MDVRGSLWVVGLIVWGCAYAAEVPAPDANGYTAYYQVPILRAGDTLSPSWPPALPPGWATEQASSAITVPDGSDISCPTASGVNGGAAGGYVIGDVGGMSELESATPRGPIFICPGDYRSALGNEIDLAASGTARTDGGLIKVMCLKANPDENPFESVANPHPGPFRTQHDAAIECLLPRLDTETQDFWFWDNVTFADLVRQGGAGASIVRNEDSQGHIYNQVWVDCVTMEGNVSAVGGACLNFRTTGATGPADDNVFQNGVVGMNAPYYNYETVVNIHEKTRNTRLINSYIFDLGHNVLTGSNALNFGEGNVIENNDIEHTEHFRLSTAGSDRDNWYAEGIKCGSTDTSCAVADRASAVSERQFDPLDSTIASFFDSTGKTGCGNSIVSLKAGSVNASNPTMVLHNRIYGARPGPEVLCASDNPAVRGIGLSFSQDPGNVFVMNNVIFDVHEGIQYSSTTLAGADYSNINVFQNIFYLSQLSYAGLSGVDDRLVASINASCTGDCGGGWNFQTSWVANWLGPIPLSDTSFRADPTIGNSPRPVYFSCNTMFGAKNQTSTSVTGQDNVSIDGTLPTFPNFTNTMAIDQSTANLTSYTFWTGLRSGDPQEVTLPLTRHYVTSPIQTHCEL